jgi:4-hydroxy-tetrahydrodipicolinate reductase
MINLIICGCSGKMGKTVLEAAAADKSVKITAGIDKTAVIMDKSATGAASASGATPHFAPPIDGIKFFDRIENCDAKCDCIIDFSKPDSLDGIIAYAEKNKTAVVFATTGYTDLQNDKIKTLSKTVPVLQSSNLSIGVYLLNRLCKDAAKILGESCEIEIIEKHHNKKVDAPSGTALTLAKNINAVYSGGKTFSYGRNGACGKRKAEEIGIHAIRGGTIVGEHEVLFICNDEVLTLGHTAYSRAIFANGALKAAKFLAARTKAGLYSMDDLSGL